MLLLMFNEFSATKSDEAWPNFSNDKNRLLSIYSRRPLAEALAAVFAYQKAFNDKYYYYNPTRPKGKAGMIIEFNLLAVSTIEDIGDELLQQMKSENVETLIDILRGGDDER